MKAKRSIILVLIAIMVTLAVFGPQGAAAPKPTKITIGISPFQDTLLPIIGQEKGWFKKAGLDVTFQTLAWNAITPALASKSIDVAVYNTTGVIAVQNKLKDIVFLYPWNIFTEGQALMGRSRVGVKSVKDFEAQGMKHSEAVKATVEQMRGKTIITTMGSDMGKAIVEVTKNNGLAKKDYTIIDMDPDQGLAAYISGSGDFYLGGIPQRTRLEQEGYLTMLVGPDLAPVPINGWVTTQSFVNKNEKALLKLQNVMFKIIRYTKANTEEVGKIITDKLNSETGASMSVKHFAKFFNEIEDYTGNASEVQRDILDKDGFAYWKKTWDNDNRYFFEVDKLIPEKVPYSAFSGEKFQQIYIKSYGANEKGW
jgi:ABC-type nitrate/sulfonate/bicarbonate transport system substrate-binding protein